MIPKIIHQIWIGPRPAPLEYIDQWRAVCDRYGWEHRLWGNEHVDQEVRFTRERYKEREHNYCHQSDLYRLEVLYRHGGVYIDADTVPTGSDPALYLPVETSDLIGVCEHDFPADDYHRRLWDCVYDPHPADLCRVALVLFCGFIGAAPRHPQVLTWLKALADGWRRHLERPSETPATPEYGAPQFSYVMSRHLYHPLTLVPFSTMDGYPDAFAEWVSILPPECYPLHRWQAIRQAHPEITKLHPEESQA